MRWAAQPSTRSSTLPLTTHNNEMICCRRQTPPSRRSTPRRAAEFDPVSVTVHRAGRLSG